MAQVREGLRRTLDALRDRAPDGVVDPAIAARVAALCDMAEALEQDPSNASLWRQYDNGLRVLEAHLASGERKPTSAEGDVSL